MLLDRDVFWIRDQEFFIASLGSAALGIFISRLLAIHFDISLPKFRCKS
jgi:uncharacterized membrane protein YeiH